MKISLFITIRQAKVKLELKSEEGTLDQISWKDEGGLSKNLLVKLESLLVKNKLKVKDLDSEIEVGTDQDSYTSARIVKITADMLQFSLEKRD